VPPSPSLNCHSERSGIIRLRMIPESRNLLYDTFCEPAQACQAGTEGDVRAFMRQYCRSPERSRECRPISLLEFSEKLEASKFPHK
jgi:hypothetical protein